VGIATWKTGGKARLLGGFAGTQLDKMTLVWKDGQSKVVSLDEVPKRGRPGVGKSIISKKIAGTLDAVVPIYIKGKPLPKKKKTAKPVRKTEKKTKKRKKK
jgi:hypothetical protein